MALTKAPLFGLDASGTVAGAIVFSKWKGRTYVRRHAVPHNPKSGLQVGMRSVFKFIAQDYVNLSAAVVARWKAIADVDLITPLNAQMRVGQQFARQNKGWVKDPAEALETTIDPPTALTATAQPKSIALNWTRPVANQGDYSVAVYQSLTGVFTRDISKLVLVQTVTDITCVITGLTTGVAYFFEVCETGGGGLLGTASAEATATPT
jgi:hypothetical protein